ncbi:MAG: DUF305 domain-containing protein [Devosia sp.]
MKTLGFAALVLLTGMSAATGQESGLPEACLSPQMGHEMDMPNEQMPMATMDEGHQAMMAGMDRMQSDMDIGMQAQDIDVAFICGMIPHHQGAIDMAKAELEYGDDPWAREMAQKVIDAQEAEIAEMKEWLAKVAP